MKVIDNYPDERLRWLIADYEGTGATSRCEAELSQLLLDLRKLSTEQRRINGLWQNEVSKLEIQLQNMEAK